MRSCGRIRQGGGDQLVRRDGQRDRGLAGADPELANAACGAAAPGVDLPRHAPEEGSGSGAEAGHRWQRSGRLTRSTRRRLGGGTGRGASSEPDRDSERLPNRDGRSVRGRTFVSRTCVRRLRLLRGATFLSLASRGATMGHGSRGAAQPACRSGTSTSPKTTKPSRPTQSRLRHPD
jgi:hypothetical protein